MFLLCVPMGTMASNQNFVHLIGISVPQDRTQLHRHDTSGLLCSSRSASERTEGWTQLVHATNKQKA
jgi:hypothetical protein